VLLDRHKNPAASIELVQPNRTFGSSPQNEKARLFRPCPYPLFIFLSCVLFETFVLHSLPQIKRSSKLHFTGSPFISSRVF
jgi:hypothetical protein